MRIQRSTALMVLAGLAACTGSTDPVAPDAPSFSLAAAANGSLGKASGGGHYVITLSSGTELSLQFALSGHQVAADETAVGNFHHRTELGGELIDFHGVLTCLAIDADEGRAWIGGVVTKNFSEREPFASGEIYQPGRDIWFRVLDVGPPSTGVDRTTFVGFEGSAGIVTSREYCDVRPWPDDNARTNPVSSGNIKVMP